MHLARFTLARVTQLSLSAETGIEMHLADAWTTIVIKQLNDCLDECLGTDAAAPSEPSEPSEQAANLSFWHVRSAEQLIYERPSEISSLRDIALYVGISERTLQAAFRKVRGATPMQVLSQARLHCARRALLDRKGPKTVSDVCSMCGIEHHGRFSKLYKEAFGEHPVATLTSRETR